PSADIIFILAAHATVTQGGGLTAILFGTPGTGTNIASLLDGPSFTKRGQGGYAVGASMTGSFIEAAIGAMVLALLIPVLKQLVLLAGPADFFMLAILALGLISILSSSEGGTMAKAAIAGALGLLLAFTGLDGYAGQPRFTFGLT